MIMIIIDKLIHVALAITRRMMNKKNEEKQTLITALKKVVTCAQAVGRRHKS